MKTQAITQKNENIHFQKARTGKTPEQLLAGIFNYSPTARAVMNNAAAKELNPHRNFFQRIISHFKTSISS